MDVKGLGVIDGSAGMHTVFQTVLGPSCIVLCTIAKIVVPGAYEGIPKERTSRIIEK